MPAIFGAGERDFAHQPVAAKTYASRCSRTTGRGCAIADVRRTLPARRSSSAGSAKTSSSTTTSSAGNRLRPEVWSSPAAAGWWKLVKEPEDVSRRLRFAVPPRRRSVSQFMEDAGECPGLHLRGQGHRATARVRRPVDLVALLRLSFFTRCSRSASSLSRTPSKPGAQVSVQYRPDPGAGTKSRSAQRSHQHRTSATTAGSMSARLVANRQQMKSS